jgi:hypothetical protein
MRPAMLRIDLGTMSASLAIDASMDGFVSRVSVSNHTLRWPRDNVARDLSSGIRDDSVLDWRGI